MAERLHIAQTARIHEALERHNGNRSLAAHELGMTSDELKNKIKTCIELRQVWMAGTPPEPILEAETISRDFPVTTEDDEQAAAALTKEENKLKKGLEELGLSAGEQALARALGRFNQRHFFKSIDIVSGGVTRAHMKLQTVLDDSVDRLLEVRKLIRAGGAIQSMHKAKPHEMAIADENGMVPTFYDDQRASLVQEEKAIGHLIVQIADTIRRMFDSQQRTNVMIATIRLKLLGKGNFNGEEKKKKPGFTPDSNGDGGDPV